MQEKIILAFGDSNTYGLNPEDGSRFDAHTRWTGVLQELLPEGWRVAEEGVCGRTTVYEEPGRPGKCGLTVLPKLLQLYCPALVLIMLGTNDCKTVFHASPEEITAGMRQLAEVVLRESSAELILISPILLGEGVSEPGFDAAFEPQSEERARGLKSRYAALATELGCGFLAASDHAAPSPKDREHLDAAGHRALAAAIANKIPVI